MKRIFVTVILTCTLCSCLGMPAGGGIVLETGTGNPVLGAEVKLECRRANFLGGSVVVKTLSATTGASGRFAFSTADVAPCTFAYVRATKSGYLAAASLDLMYRHDNFSAIPKQIVLTRETDKIMVRLQFLAAIVKATSAPDSAYLYSTLYPSFDEARRIANTDKERAYVLTSVCPYLLDVYSKLSNEDRVSLHGKHLMGFDGPSTIDHEGQLVPYCRASVPVR